MTEARELIRRLAEKERNFRQREFLAPFTPASQSVIVKMDGLNYTFRIKQPKDSGLGIFRPVDPYKARLLRLADDETRQRYFRILPYVHLTLAFETDKGWVAFPTHVESSRRRMGLDVDVVVRNVTDCERFDVIVARFDGVHFWFDEPFSGADVIKADEMRQCFSADKSEKQMRQALGQVNGVTPEDAHVFELAIQSWKQFMKVTTEDRLKDYLKPGGGRLGSYVVRGDNIELRWFSESGQSYTSLIKKDTMDVVTAGICLDPHDGTGPQDQQYHLKDLPFVIREGERDHLIYRRNIDFT